MNLLKKFTKLYPYLCAPIKDNIQPLIDKSSNEMPRKNAKKAEIRIILKIIRSNTIFINSS